MSRSRSNGSNSRATAEQQKAYLCTNFVAASDFIAIFFSGAAYISLPPVGVGAVPCRVTHVGVRNVLRSSFRSVANTVNRIQMTFAEKCYAAPLGTRKGYEVPARARTYLSPRRTLAQRESMQEIAKDAGKDKTDTRKEGEHARDSERRRERRRERNGSARLQEV